MVNLRFGTLLRFTLGLMTLHGLGLSGCGRETGKYLSGKRTSEITTVSKEQLMKELQQVVAFFIQYDLLYLELSDNGGTMRFRRVDEQVVEK